MKFCRFCHDDTAAFRALAVAEGWLCDPREFDFLFKEFPQGCHACRIDDVPVGFVTSVKYARSGWIGNLLVKEEFRSRGIGAALMGKTLEILSLAATETIWLTASEAGKAIYLNLGFTAVDTVQRWVGRGQGKSIKTTDRFSLEVVIAMDEAGWGDRRDKLVAAAIKRGRVFADQHGFIVRQDWCAGMQLGPWGGECHFAATELLDTCLRQADSGGLVFLDVPAGNLRASELLEQRGFTVKGSTALMYRGVPPAFDSQKIYALASMGSCG